MGKRSHFNPQRLRDLREMKGLTAEAFAKPLNITARTIANWEKGVTSPTMRELEALCAHYDIDLASFLIGTPEVAIRR
jgi:transcriptional regulator with XRE-family HTH domain